MERTYAGCNTGAVNEVSKVAPELIQVRVKWAETGDARPVHVNQALGQVGPPGSDGLPDGIYVTMGVVPPPPLSDENPDDRDQLLAKLRTEGITVNIAGQFHMSRQMLGDLMTLLQTTADKYDAVLAQAKTGAGGQPG